MAKPSAAVTKINDQLTQEGVNAAAALALVFQNRFPEAKVALAAVAEQSIQGAFAQAFFAFIQGFLTQEPDELQQARSLLDGLRKRAENFDKKKEISGASANDNRKLLYQLVDAQAAVLTALLMFAEASWSDALRGAMLLRSAYNAFDALAKTAGVTQDNVAQLGAPLTQLSAEQLQAFQTAAGIQPAAPAATPPAKTASPPPAPAAASVPPVSPSVPTSSGEAPPILPPTLKADLEALLPQVHPTVFGGIAFGAGLFNLLLSLLPPSRRSVAEWLGFSGDRVYGLSALRAAAQAGGIASVFATITLVTFHTSISMFHSRGDGSGIVQAGRLLQRCLVLYPNSAVFLWYLGRWLRAAGAVHAATAAYNRAFHAQTEWTSLQAICRYELAWCCMLTLRFAEAHGHFALLARDSSWSKAFCEYAAGINAQACRCYTVAAAHFAKVPSLIQMKGGRVPPFEHWAQQRAEQFTTAHSALKDKLPEPLPPLGSVSTAASPVTAAAAAAAAAAGGGDAAAPAEQPPPPSFKPPPLTADTHSRLIEAVAACIEAGTDADSVECSALQLPQQAQDTPPEGTPATQGGGAVNTEAEAEGGNVCAWDLLLAEPVLEMAYLWNTFSQSSSLSRFARERAQAIQALRQQCKNEDVFCAEHLATSDGSGGFLGIGKKARQCSVAEEGAALLLLVQGAASRALGDRGGASAALQALRDMVDSGRIAAESRNNFVHPSLFFESAMLAQEGGDVGGALAELTEVQGVVEAHDVHFGNRLSFRAKQSETDLKEQQK